MSLPTSVLSFGRSLIAVAVLIASVTTSFADPKPNVLFIVVDDLNWRLGCYGSEILQTPHLDRLAANGVRFDRAYCNYPVCSASRTSFLSGRYASTTGVLGNGPDPREILGASYRFLPEYFQDHGYYTSGVGKIPHTPEHIGSLQWDFHRDTQWEPSNPFETVAKLSETKAWPDEKHPDGITARVAVEIMEQDREEPFFLAVGFHRPHAPRGAPQKYWDLYDPEDLALPPNYTDLGAPIPAAAIPPRYEPENSESEIRKQLHAYYTTASFIDDQAGILFDALDRNDLWNDTVVVFFSDHGVHLGDHGGFWGKQSLMEEALKVPLLVQAPGMARGIMSQEPVELIDLFPTLTELCGLPDQPGVEGESLVPLLQSEEATRAKEKAFAMVRRDGKNNPIGYTVRTRQWAYTEWPDSSKQLYHHTKDPGEANNLADDPNHAQTQQRLAGYLKRHRSAHPIIKVAAKVPGNSVSAFLPRKTAPENAPNIIVIVADDLGYEDLSINNTNHAQTQYIDSIAKNGIRFTNAYITAPVCSPSRAGFLTGRYQNRFGFEFLVNEVSILKEGHTNGLPPTEVTLATRMKEQGYVTGCIGKWHVGTEEECLPTNRGFDEFYGTLRQGNYFTPNLVDSRIDTKPRKVSDSDYYLTDDYAERAVEFIETHQKRPFFLYLPHFAVHKPHDASPEYLKRFRHIEDPVRQSYLAMLSAMDDAVGRVLAALKKADLEDNTLILFFSDNGGTQGSSNLPLRGKKGSTWEGGVRTPFLIQWKDQFEGGGQFDGIVSALDVFPTTLAAAGVKVEPEWQLDGVNLIPILQGQKGDLSNRTLYWRFGTQWAIRKGPWKLLQAREARGGDIQIAKVGPVRLFHLENDMAEEDDLAPGIPDKVESLQKRWEDWNATLPEPSWRPRPID